MTKNEIIARKILDGCVEHGVDPRSFEGKIVLTDKECINIAVNFPFPLAVIRKAFFKKNKSVNNLTL